MKIIAVDILELGNRSYIVHDGNVGVVFDPSRRIQQIIDIAAKAKINIKAVFETHIHNDYVTGGFRLSQKLEIPYYISAQDKVSFKRQPIEHEQTIKVGKINVTALASPGHTPHHLSYLVEGDKGQPALFSGGSLLYGAVGRTDLISPKLTLSLAKSQYQTARFFVERLQPDTELYPTHGFGSFCASTDTEHVNVSTIKEQLKTNQVYKAKDEASFVKEMVDELDDHPAYYKYMAPANLGGPLDPDLGTPALLSKDALTIAVHTGSAVIDLRSRVAYASKHMLGSYNIEINNSLATYIGWLLNWNEPLILVSDNMDEIEAMQEQLSLIGRELITGRITPEDLLRSTDKLGSYPVKSFVDLAKVINKDDVVLVDIRRNNEWKKVHIKGSLHIPLHEIEDRISELPTDKKIWIHCAAGFRAAIASSIVSAHGLSPFLIDDIFINAEKAGLETLQLQDLIHDVELEKAQLVDVREQDEWDEGHAEDAFHIPLDTLLEKENNELNKDTPIYVYCRSGRRSGIAESFLKNKGYKAVNVGGLNEWTLAGGKVSK